MSRNRTLAAGCVGFSMLLAVLSCTGTRPRGVGPLPPRDLLLENLARASLVISLEVQDVTPVKEFVDDQGVVGYVQYAVSGQVIEVFKREVPVTDDITYSFTAERAGAVQPWPHPGDELLVFLEPTPPGDALWLIAEGAQFPLVDKLPRIMRKLAAEQRR